VEKHEMEAKKPDGERIAELAKHPVRVFSSVFLGAFGIAWFVYGMFYGGLFNASETAVGVGLFMIGGAGFLMYRYWAIDPLVREVRRLREEISHLKPGE